MLSAAMLAAGMPVQAFASNDGEQVAGVVAVEKINPTTVELRLNDGH